MATCTLCLSNRFCAVPGRTPEGILLRCTREPGHDGIHAACGEEADEHPIFRWRQPVRQPNRRFR